MKKLGYDSNNSEIYKIVEDKLGDKKSKKGIKKFFNIFNGEANSDKINFDKLKKISQ